MALAVTAFMLGLCPGRASAQSAVPSDLTKPLNVATDVTLAADEIKTWMQGDLRYMLGERGCSIQQGGERVKCDKFLTWFHESKQKSAGTIVEVLATGNVITERPGNLAETKTELHFRRTTNTDVNIKTTRLVRASGADDALFARSREIEADRSESQDSSPPALLLKPEDQAKAKEVAAAKKPAEVDRDVQPAQFGTAIGAPQSFQADTSHTVHKPQGKHSKGLSSVTPNGGISGGVLSGGGVRSVRVSPRGSQRFQSSLFKSDDGMDVIVVTGGVNVIVQEVDSGSIVDLLADRAVIWTRIKGVPGADAPMSGNSEFQTDKKQPLEVYLEGNVILAQGNVRNTSQKITSSRLSGKQIYFNANTNQALLLNGKIETFDAQSGVPLIMTADEIRQLTPEKFYAREAKFTTSPYQGTPGYAFTSSSAILEEKKQELRSPFTGNPILDPQTGAPITRSRHYATGYSDFLQIEGVPVFYWPYLKANVEDPLGPLEEVRLGHSSNLGFTTGVSLDAWQLLGLDYLPMAERSNWLLDINYHDQRGLSGGSRFNYMGEDLFGLPGRYYGNYLSWFINDHGSDDLGAGRMDIFPPDKLRGRTLFQHHQELPNDMTLIAEFSYLSDRNFLESFYESEYDSGKDQDTLIYLKQQKDFWAWSLLAQPRLHSFLPQNEYLPKADLYTLGVPLWNQNLTYFGHSSVTYARVRPPDQYPLSTDYRLDTARFDTRHEIDAPIKFGPMNVTPFVVGEFTAYSETQSANGLSRLYGAAGVRTSLPFWRAFPDVESEYFNLNGLAHKVEPYANYMIARSNRDFNEIPVIDQFDDDTSELVRRQNLIRQFGGPGPLEFDPRFYALRKNITFLPEVLDDQQTARIGIDQRLQTKRGPIGGQRIIDWMTLDLGATIFPEKDRNDFGEYLGFIDGTWQWHIGDRTSVLSSFVYEPFDNRKSITGAVYFQRPPRSSVTVFFNHYDAGPLQSDYLGTSISYRFSTKYAGSLTVGYDFDSNDNVSISGGITRVGLDFVATLGIVFNAGRNDLGLQFEFIPRAAARSKYQRNNVSTLPFGIEPSATVSPIVEDRLSNSTNTFSTN